MNIGLGIEADRSIDHLMASVRGVNNVLNACFKNREYGSDLIIIDIGMILVTGPISERLHPVRPFEYTRYAKEKSRITGEIFEVHKTAGWDIKPDFEKFKIVNLKQARDYLCEVLIASTAVLEEHRSEFPDFDVARFRADFEACLRAHCSD